MKYLVLLLIIGLSVSGLQAQQKTVKKLPEPKSLVVLGKRMAQKNVIRWAATDYVSWQQIAKTGVYVERYSLDKGRIDRSTRRLLTPQALKPQPLEQWKKIFAPQDTAAGAAAQAQFGEAVPLSGGGELDAIVAMEMQQGMMYGVGMLMADWRPDLAVVMGLRLEDIDIQAGESYVYRVFAAGPDAPKDTVACFVKPDLKWRPPSVTDIKALELEQSVQLSWTDEGNIYPASGYFIERSADGGKTFKRLNSRPFIKINTKESEALEEDRIVYLDSMGVNYRPFQYRVVGFNAFGEMGTESAVITAMGRDRTPPGIPQIMDPEFQQGVGLKIHWEISNPGEIKGFIIGHSNDAGSQFTPLHNGLLPASARSFTDPVAQARGNVNYYVITAIDTAGNAITSMPRHYFFENTTPPATPTGLKATIDSTGHMVLSWKQNTEPDFMGYNVFFANAADHEFLQLNGEPLKNDTFVHNLNLRTLTEEIYYKVVALDDAFNPSDFSEVLRVKKPDILPPAAPLIKDVTVNEKGIQLTWAPSPSPDAAGSRLFRRKSGETVWNLLREFPQTQKTFTDTAVVIGQIYEYCLQAKDDDGLLSEYCTAHQGRAYPSPVGPGVQGFTAVKDPEKTLARLSWQFNAKSAARIYVYRAFNDGTLQLLTSLAPNENKFADTAVQSGRKYRYAAKVVYDSGAESAMTAPAEIVFE